eukprot:CAMPEP_0170480364 /NCGR_PEP_ID=MMETSP0208-20121228/1234_1 /TAXON_ID=197538 /ORGANISM="Strombidium inclinatum, Strain S3" /LENGTH=117 /DNA_ID=CAMNT_0010752899 /DNA_START=387 /DNA_END=740 /DNA_ORIENTATION=-
MKLLGLVGGHQSVSVAGDEEGGQRNLWDDFLVLPLDAQDEWFQGRQDREQVVNHVGNGSERVLYDEPSEVAAVRLRHVERDSSSKATALQKDELRVDSSGNLFIDLERVLNELEYGF